MTTDPRGGFIARRRWWLLGGLVLVIYGVTGGCYAQQLPPSLDAADAALVDAGPLPYSVVVVPWDPSGRQGTGQNADAYQKPAYQFLKLSGAFRAVRMGVAGDSADLVATSTHDYCNSAIIPIWTGLTLGLFPTVWTDTDCTGVVLRRFGATRADTAVVIASHRASRTVMGWAAVVVGTLPGWTHGEARDHRRAGQVTHLAIIQRRTAIAALLAPRLPPTVSGASILRPTP